MRLSRIVIKNFRNFKHLDVRLGQHAVVLGENKVGKTNLLFALRLILDPTLPDSARKLRLDDFWDGLTRPLKAGDAIEVSVEFRDFDDNENLLAVLADHLVQPDPMVAKVTYRYQPVPGLERAPRSEADYEFVLYGGNRPENAIGYELKRWIPMDLFPALRDDQRREAEETELDRLLGECPPMRALKSTIRQVLTAESQLRDADAPAVLVLGETGSGKELVARALHFNGPRRDKPFVELNCASIPAQLLESELFGHERGAFTDARERKLGLVETAEGGTLFLDEIGDMDLGLQAKLLKLLEGKTVRRVGSVRDQRVNVRIVAATHRPLEMLVQEKTFRADLYYRLRVVQLTLPPLRERGSDIMRLAEHFVAEHARRYGKPVPALGPSARNALERHSWPGNVRELRNVLEQAVLLCGDGRIEAAQLTLSGSAAEVAGASPGAGAAGTLASMERQMLLRALDRTAWNVSRAARELGLSRDTLRYRIEKLGLKVD